MIIRFWKRFPAAAAFFNMAAVCVLAVLISLLFGLGSSKSSNPGAVGWLGFMLGLAIICGFSGVVAIVTQLLLERHARRRIQRRTYR